MPEANGDHITDRVSIGYDNAKNATLLSVLQQGDTMEDREM